MALFWVGPGHSLPMGEVGYLVAHWYPSHIIITLDASPFHCCKLTLISSSMLAITYRFTELDSMNYCYSPISKFALLELQLEVKDLCTKLIMLSSKITKRTYENLTIADIDSLISDLTAIKVNHVLPPLDLKYQYLPSHFFTTETSLKLSILISSLVTYYHVNSHSHLKCNI